MVELVEVEHKHLDVFYLNQQDSEANDLAKVFPRDRDDFDAHWARIMSNPEVIARTITFNGEVVGNINAFKVDSEMHVGYWIDKAHWGKGIATKALRGLLEIIGDVPLHALVAKNNIGSCKVLERCGFVKARERESDADKRYMACTECVYERKVLSV